MSMRQHCVMLVWVLAAAVIKFHCHKKLVIVNWKFRVPSHPAGIFS